EDIKEGTSFDLSVRLKGPGIKAFNDITFRGLDIRYINDIKELNSSYPLGIDVIFVGLDGSIACISRTTKLEVV
ncbi:MAG TPA: phosphonate C-P lyase system protein PhnH, partial [Clostridia bacterium]